MIADSGGGGGGGGGKNVLNLQFFICIAIFCHFRDSVIHHRVSPYGSNNLLNVKQIFLLLYVIRDEYNTYLKTFQWLPRNNVVRKTERLDMTSCFIYHLN